MAFEDEDLIHLFTRQAYTGLQAQKIDPNSPEGRRIVTQAISLAGQISMDAGPLPGTEALSPFMILTLAYALGLKG